VSGTTRKAPASAPNGVGMLLAAAAAILLLNMGARQSLGLFIAPMASDRPISVVEISFAFAVSQLVWGMAQPVFGGLVERWGSLRVIVLGALMVMTGTALTPLAQSAPMLTLLLGILTAAGAGAGSFSILIGWLARYLPAERRPFAAGLINAGSSLGQFIFAPLTQALIASLGWVMAMEVLALSALGVIPLAVVLARQTAARQPEDGPGQVPVSLASQLRVASADPGYRLIHAGFFTCGFHIGFLTTHLPGEVALCSLAPAVSATSLALIGLFNVAGSIGAGWLSQRMPLRYLLAGLYASRALLILGFLALPKTPAVFYLFSALLGLTWLATVPPTSGLIGRLFGARYLATLFGLALLTHQVGGFFGAWLGGATIARFGDFNWMWYADAALALFAAVSQLPIREKPVLAPA
jgi:predicted MFS family arabinose efflux permease